MKVLTDFQIMAPPSNPNLMILTDGTIDEQARLAQIAIAVRTEGVWTVTADGADDFHTPYRGEAIDAMMYNGYLALPPGGYSINTQRGLRDLP